MDYYKDPSNNYRDTFKKGRIYRAPFPFLRKEKIFVRPLYDESEPEIPGDLFVEDESGVDKNDLFDHKPFPNLNLKRDEEFIVQKTKKRPVLLINSLGNLNKVFVAPIKTINQRYRQKFDIEELKKEQNSISDLLYLPASSKFSLKESLVFLCECKPLLKKDLEPRPIELNSEVIDIIDNKLVDVMGLFKNYEEDSSSGPILT